MASTKEIGDFGEQKAQLYLKNLRYEILEVNWRYKQTEVDIILHDGETLVFVEVKTRSSALFGDPADFVDEKKQQHLIKAAEAYIDKVNYSGEIRFDIVAVSTGKEETKLEHIKDAFWHY